MPAGRTETDVANKALTLLGSSRRILSLDDRTPLARTMKNLFAPTRDEVLVDHPWNEAIVRITLSPSVGGDVPETRYTNAFLMPGDCLRWLPWNSDDSDYFDGVQEGRYLLSDSATIVARYIRRLEQVSLWSVGLETSIASKLAFYAAKPVTGQTSVQRMMADLYSDSITAGKRQDGLKTGDRSRRATYRSRWLAARMGRRDYIS